MKKTVKKSKNNMAPKSHIKDRELTEAKLINAAEFVFSKHGFNGATTRMIAAKAEVNIALINRYFNGKYGLMLKIIEMKAKEFSSDALPYPISESITQELLNYSQHATENFYKNRNFLKIFLVQFLTDSNFQKKLKDYLKLFSPNVSLISRLKLFNSNSKMGNNFDAELIVSTIEDIILSQITYDVLLIGTDKEIILDRQKNFIKIICSNYENLK